MARLLGIDPGTARCGLAITNAAGTMAFPREALANDDHLVAALELLVEDDQVEGIVVGRPVALSGSATASTREADTLFHTLVNVFGELRVVQWDERLTTVEAQRSLSRAGVKAKAHRGHVDSAAAVIMLQSYLDGQRG